MSNPQRFVAMCAAPAVTFIAAKENADNQTSSTVPDDINIPHADGTDVDPWVPFTVQVRRSTYVALKQAEYWTPGFGQIREHVEEAIRPYFAALPGSKKPLPYKEIAKNKKLQF